MNREAPRPRLSLVMVLDDEAPCPDDTLRSCLRQTAGDVDVVCVNTGASERLLRVVRDVQRGDDRVRLVDVAAGASRVDAYAAGNAAAFSPYVMFVSQGDRLLPDAAAEARASADRSRADVVGFARLHEDGPDRLEAGVLSVPDVLPCLLDPEDHAVPGTTHLMYRTELVSRVCDALASSGAAERTSEKLIPVLAVALAQRFAVVDGALHLRPSASRASEPRTAGSPIDEDEPRMLALALLAAARPALEWAVGESPADTGVLAAYDTLRLRHICGILRECVGADDARLGEARVRRVAQLCGHLDLIRASARLETPALRLVAQVAEPPPEPRRSVSRVLLSTENLRTGGLQGVLVEHAARLADRGISATVVLTKEADRELPLPDRTERVLLDGTDLPTRLDAWIALCREMDPDAVVDHHILYNEQWPWFALAASALGIPTFGWLHNFALRPVFDGTDRLAFLSLYLPVLSRVTTLTPLDVAFWKLRGLQRVAWIPNPPSRLARIGLAEREPRDGARTPIRIAWWGRLDPNTKQVLQLVDVAAALKARQVDFQLTILGPDSRTLTAADVLAYADESGVADDVRLIGERSVDELADALRDADLLVMTSAIEGSPLTIVEAQAWAMPVVMYSLPWTGYSSDEVGVIAVPQGDASAIADEVESLASDPARYAVLSRSARESARRSAGVDVGRLIIDLMEDRLPATHSPAPTSADGAILLDVFARFHHRNAESLARARQVERERDAALRSLEQIRRGASFRIGRALTSIARKATGRP